jgi:predicted transcriptional regulator
MVEERENSPTSVAMRWGAAVARGGYGTGWTPIPAALVRNIAELGLKPTDVAVLLAILANWWEADRMPNPRISTIARHIGLNRRTVERSVRRLMRLNLLIWKRSEDTARGKRREFDLSPLRDRVARLAERDFRLFSRTGGRASSPSEVDEIIDETRARLDADAPKGEAARVARRPLVS